jgi:hypothetical protein
MFLDDRAGEGAEKRMAMSFGLSHDSRLTRARLVLPLAGESHSP